MYKARITVIQKKIRSLEIFSYAVENLTINTNHTIQHALLLKTRKTDGFDMAMTVPSEDKYRTETIGYWIIQLQG